MAVRNKRSVNQTHLKLFCLSLLFLVGETFNVPCPDDWLHSTVSGSCLRQSNDRKNFDEARTACKLVGGDLVRILDFKMESFIRDNLHLNQLAYIGLLEEPGSKQWLNSTPLTGFAERSLRPRGSYDYNCGTIFNRTTRWDFVQCSREYEYLCEIGYDLCDDGWVPSSSSGTCIKLYKGNKLPWAEARQTCQDDGADLVKILNKDMNNFIYDQLILDDMGTFYFIGLHGGQSGQFQWLDDPRQLNYTAFSSTSVHQKFDCAVMDSFPSHNQPKFWWIKNCSDSMRFICEKYADCSKETFGMVRPKHCGENCMDGKINQQTGRCVNGCREGYEGPPACIKNIPTLSSSNGNSNEIECSPQCKDGKCDNQTGHCLHGCSKGYEEPPTCINKTHEFPTNRTDDNDDDRMKGERYTLLSIIAAAVFALFVLLMFMIPRSLVQRKRKETADASTQHEEAFSNHHEEAFSNHHEEEFFAEEDELYYFETYPEQYEI